MGAGGDQRGVQTGIYFQPADSRLYEGHPIPNGSGPARISREVDIRVAGERSVHLVPQGNNQTI